MKCFFCHKNGDYFCMKNSHNICIECCHKEQSIEMCDNNCNKLIKEKCNYISPKNTVLFQISNGRSTVFSETLFLPNIFNYFAVDVSNYNLSFVSFNTIKISFDFIVYPKSDRKIKISEAYLHDKWKPHNNDRVPFLQVCSKLGFIVENAILRYNEDIKEKVTIENNHLDTWLPFAKTKYEELSDNEILELNTGGEVTKSFVYYGSHFEHRNSTFYSKILENHTYSISFEIVNISGKIDRGFIINSFGLFFPFHYVKIGGLNILYNENIMYQLKLMKLQPLENRTIYAFLTPIKSCDVYQLEHKNRFEINANELIDSYEYSDYSILYHSLAFSSNEILLIDSRINSTPLCLSLYDDINKIFDNEYAPIDVEILNRDTTFIELSICIKIDDLSPEWIEVEDIRPMSSKTIKLAPPLLSNAIKDIYVPTYKGVSVSVKYNGNIVYEKSHKILVYPRNYFLFKLQSKTGDWEIELRPYIARWVTPHSPEVAKVISDASEYGSIEGYIEDGENNSLELRYIYDAMSHKIEYVNRTYALSEDGSFIQKILLPSDTLKYKYGNCIDLTVALASCYEEIGYDTYVVLIEGHAFLRVKISRNQYINIESTFLGRYDFEKAINKAQKEFDENFYDNGQPKNVDSFIVDISLSRDEKILPME